jgi:hypothetical protein
VKTGNTELVARILERSRFRDRLALLRGAEPTAADAAELVAQAHDVMRSDPAEAAARARLAAHAARRGPFGLFLRAAEGDAP